MVSFLPMAWWLLSINWFNCIRIGTIARVFGYKIDMQKLVFHISVVILTLTMFSSKAICADTNASVYDDGCRNCHLFQYQMIESDGNGHAESVTCFDCHSEHQAAGVETSPCAACHDSEPHYELDDCLECHRDPHRPLFTLRDTLKPEIDACLSCHGEVGQAMIDYPGKHAEMYCTSCHSRHRQSPSCLDCHTPHNADGNSSSCAQCHSVHRSGAVEFRGYISNSSCSTCHREETAALTMSDSNHSGLNCVYCHSRLHPTVPKCNDCHGLAHSQQLHSLYRDCLVCHGDAHNLISR